MEGQALIDEKLVSNTFLNNTSFNEDSFKDNRRLIAGYPEGRILKVTYFSQNTPVADVFSKPVDINMRTLDDVHISWTQIRNFELRIQNELSFEYDADTGRSAVTSTGIVLPGFTPKVGDFFLYMMKNGKVGMFYVTEFSRLALGQETYHSINFSLQQWLDMPMRDRLQKQSTMIFYFDKEKFLTGNVAMLSTEGYVQKKELQHIRREIIQNYLDRFYDTEFNSFMRYDDVYDPYIVEFWLHKVSCNETKERPIQLFCSIQNYKKTIWSALTNNPIKQLKNINSDYDIQTDFHTFWDVNITALIGHQFLTVGNERGAEKNPTVSSDGTPNAINAYPYNLGYYEPWRSKFRENSFDQLDMDRFFFYRGFLPFRRCAPHQHPIDFPFDANSCDPKKCMSCSTDKNGNHYKKQLFRPPFPIASNEELGMIWRKMERISDKVPLTPQQEAELRGYILWYRTEYPGTLSRMELEAEWRSSASLDPNKQLTPEEEKGLLEYISSYRKNFLPVLQDRELEYIWRTRNRIAFENELTTEEKTQVMLAIGKYREYHGFVPDDENTTEFPVIGSPISSEEVRTAGAVMYSDLVILDMDLDDYLAMQDGKPIQPKPDITPSDHVPTIYHHKHPLPNQHVHCHSICHELCNKPPKRPTATQYETSDTYALSSAFYSGSIAMDPFERLVYDCLTNKEVKPGLILDAVNGYLDWDDTIAFYRHLLSIYLIDKALFWLKFHS